MLQHHTVTIESTFDKAELHELLCKAIHELDIHALKRLGWGIADISHEVPIDQQPGSVETALDYLIESFDLLPESVTPVRHAIKCILTAHGA